MDDRENAVRDLVRLKVAKGNVGLGTPLTNPKRTTLPAPGVSCMWHFQRRSKQGCLSCIFGWPPLLRLSFVVVYGRRYNWS